MADTLVGHPYTGKLRLDKHPLLIDMKKSQVKPINILHTLNENNEDRDNNQAIVHCHIYI